MKSTTVSIALLFTLSAAWVRADAWDVNDDQTNKPHDLTHGSEEAHDLAARAGPLADVDWSRVPMEAYSSYEVFVDGAPAHVDAVELTRFDAAGTSLLQTAGAPNAVGGLSRVLEWKNGATAAFNLVRVQGAACAATCGKDATYRIRAAETTIAVPRFNNTGSQQTTLYVQNLRGTTRSVTVYFWNHLGVLQSSATSTFTVPARGSASLPTFINATNLSGTITIAHDAGYGGLAVKAVTTDSGAGTSTDTEGTYRAR